MQIRICGFLVFLLIVTKTPIYAASCEAVGNEVEDEDGSTEIVAFLSEDFPNTDCSFGSLNVNPQSLRFANLTFGGAGGTFFDNPFVNLGSRFYELDENVEIFDTRDDDCDFDEDSFFINNQTIAFILSGDSLNAPRVITQMWILDCDINTTR